MNLKLFSSFMVCQKTEGGDDHDLAQCLAQRCLVASYFQLAQTH